MEGKKGMIYAVDFDGTIAFTDYPAIIGPNARVVEFIKEVQKRGDRWILWTNRCGKALEEAVAWLEMNGLHPDAINENLPDMVGFFGGDPRKVFANIYIDDRNAGGLRLPEDPDPGALGADGEFRRENGDAV